MNSVLALQEQSTGTHDYGYGRLADTLQALSLQEGIQVLKQFLQTYPSFAQAHNDLAIVYHRAGSPTLALAHHEKASRLQPENITFRKNIADFYAVELGWLDDAVDIYLEILKRNPRDTEALIALGQLGSAMEGKISLAPPAVRHELEAPPAPSYSAPVPPQPQTPSPVAPPVKSFDDLYSDVQELARAGRFAEARAALENLVRSEPSRAILHNDLGVVCYNLGEKNEARANYEKAVSLAPDNDLFARNLADFYFAEAGLPDDAINIYLGLHRKNPRDVETLVNLGHICASVGKPAEAKIFYRRALEIEPWNRDARNSLSVVANAEQTYHSPVVHTVHRSAEELHAEAQRLAAEERHHEAHSILEELVHCHADNAVAHNDLGVVRHRLGDIQGARSAYERATQLHPVNLNFARNLADLYFVELNRADDAISIYLDLHRKHPRDVETLVNLGHICVAVGRPDEARIFFRRALEIEPWNTEAREAVRSVA